MSEVSGPASSLTGFIDAAHAGWVAENQAAAQRFVACHALFRQCLAQWEQQEQSCAGARPGHAVVDPFTVATGYVVSAMAISSVRAETMLSFAWDLHERYPAILAALSAGRLDQAAAERLARQMGAVDDQVLARVQQEVVDDYLATIEAGERPGAQAIRDRVDEIIAAHDPAGVTDRKAAAARDRGVHIRKGADGMANLWATLAAEEAAILAEAIDARVRQHEDADTEAFQAAADRAGIPHALRGSGPKPDPLPYRRADALMSLLCGDTGPHGQSTPPPQLRPSITVIAPNSGTGAGGDACGSWVEFARTGQAALQTLMDMLATADGATLERLDPRIGAADHTVVAGAAGAALKYRPRAALARRIRLRDGTCRHPGCTVAAENCDIDHLRPFDHANPALGGPTTEDNLVCLCRRHHRFKTFSDWTYQLQPDGTLTVTTPEGRHMLTRPTGPLAAYRREQARAETRAWEKQQQRNPDPTTTGTDDPPTEPTYWTRRAARRASQRARAAHATTGPSPTSPGAADSTRSRPADHSRWWQRNKPAISRAEHNLQQAIDDILDPPPF